MMQREPVFCKVKLACVYFCISSSNHFINSAVTSKYHCLAAHLLLHVITVADCISREGIVISTSICPSYEPAVSFDLVF